jgi:hypothetical protein
VRQGRRCRGRELALSWREGAGHGHEGGGGESGFGESGSVKGGRVVTEAALCACCVGGKGAARMFEQQLFDKHNSHADIPFKFSHRNSGGPAHW